MEHKGLQNRYSISVDAHRIAAEQDTDRQSLNYCEGIRQMAYNRIVSCYLASTTANLELCDKIFCVTCRGSGK